MDRESERSAHELELPITSYKDEYMHDGESVSVFWNEVTSEQADAQNPKAPIVYIPGWSVDSDNPAAREISSIMADTDKTTVYTVDPRIKNPQEDGIRIQAEALSQWVKERGVTEFTLAGNSLGAIESAYLFSYLKKHAPEVKINGLLLFEGLRFMIRQQGNLLKDTYQILSQIFLKLDYFHPYQRQFAQEQ